MDFFFKPYNRAREGFEEPTRGKLARAERCGFEDAGAQAFDDLRVSMQATFIERGAKREENPTLQSILRIAEA